MREPFPFASGTSPFDTSRERTLEDVIAESNHRTYEGTLSQDYHQPRTAAVEAAEARRYPEPELQPLPPVPVTTDEAGQQGWELEPAWPKEQRNAKV